MAKKRPGATPSMPYPTRVKERPTLEEYLDAHPFSVQITVQPIHNRGGELPTGFSTTTQLYEYVDEERMQTIQETAIGSLFSALAGLAKKPAPTK